MPNENMHFLNCLAQDFIEGRLAAMAEHFTCPVPVYFGTDLQVFGACNTLVEGLTYYRDAARHHGITRVVPRIIAEGLTVRRYSNIWVEWDHFDATDKCVLTSQVRYVFYQRGAALFPKIELVEYNIPAFPHVTDSLFMSATA